MNKTLLSVFAITATTLLATACERGDDISNLPPGKYEKTTRSTDAYGTTTESTRSTEVDEDAYGNKRAVIEDKTTKDPKGLLNKRTTSNTKKVIEDKKTY